MFKHNSLKKIHFNKTVGTNKAGGQTRHAGQVGRYAREVLLKGKAQYG